MTSTLISDQAEVSAVLADPGYQVPPAPAPGDNETGTLTWLRASVSRFSEGGSHERRRALAEGGLARMDPVRLREAAAALTAAELARSASEPFDAMRLARRVPLAVLVAELGVPGILADSAVDAAITAASAYLNPDGAGADADAAVAFLVRALGPDATELTANRIGLLMQACDATAGLIGNAMARALSASSVASGAEGGDGQVHADHDGPVREDRDGPVREDHSLRASTVDELIAATLREDPPVRRTRRMRPDGEVVLVDLTGQTFGGGRRPCPAADHATALAAGIVDSILPACVLADPHIAYPEVGNLRMPTTLSLVVAKPST